MNLSILWWVFNQTWADSCCLSGCFVRQWPYRVPQALQLKKKKNMVWHITGSLKNHKVLHFNNLNIMVAKSYGTLQLCNDFWKLDTVSQVDSYLMTQVDDLNECLDKARSILTLNLTKGCHPQHKKQPSASQMDCSSNDFSLLASKGDTSTSTI